MKQFGRVFAGFEFSILLLGLGLGALDLARWGDVYYGGVFVVIAGIVAFGVVMSSGPRPMWVYLLSALLGVYAWWNLTWSLGWIYIGGATGGSQLPANVSLLGAAVPEVQLPLWAFFLTTFVALTVSIALPIEKGKRTYYHPGNGRRVR